MKYETRIYAPIGGYTGIDPEDFAASIPGEATEITVRIHSPGGSVGDGLAIYHTLKDHPAKVTTIVDGYAASAASFIMLAGDEVRVHRSSIVMIHNPWTQMAGDSNDLRKAASDLDVHRDAILEIYRQKTGYTEEELKQMMDEETYFLGMDAVEMGFADVVIDDYEEEKEIAAMIQMERIAANILKQEMVMSKVKTRKDIEAELDLATYAIAEKDQVVSQLQEQILNLEVANSEKIAAIESEVNERIDLIVAEKDAAEKASAEAAEKIAALEAEIAAKAEEIESRDSVIEVLNKQVSETSSELASVTVKLENPAFVDASSSGQEAVAESGESEDSAITPHIDAYNSLTDAVAKTRYWNDHRNEIQSEMKKLSAR